MSSVSILYQSRFKIPIKPLVIKNLVKQIFKAENIEFEYLHIVFCNDDFLLDINQRFLRHDYLTDIITFNYSNSTIEGELYISHQRLVENAKIFNKSIQSELARLVTHGVLHLCGYSDKTHQDKLKMRKLENFYLSHIL